MNRNSNDLDRNLQAMFRENNRDLEAEPFIHATLKRIDQQRFYRNLAGLLLRLFALAGIVVISPALIRGSMWLSENLGKLFDLGSDVLANPKGTFLAVLIGIAVLFANTRRRFHRP
jgi:hypothetical protein